MQALQSMLWSILVYLFVMYLSVIKLNMYVAYTIDFAFKISLPSAAKIDAHI